MKKIRKSLIIAYLCAIVTSAAAQQDSRFFTGECSDIHPKGWLETMLQRQHDGLTGHPEALSRIKTLYFYYFGRTEAFSHFDERVKVFAAEVTEPDALEKAAEANPSYITGRPSWRSFTVSLSFRIAIRQFGEITAITTG